MYLWRTVLSTNPDNSHNKISAFPLPNSTLAKAETMIFCEHHPSHSMHHFICTLTSPTACRPPVIGHEQMKWVKNIRFDWFNTIYWCRPIFPVREKPDSKFVPFKLLIQNLLTMILHDAILDTFFFHLQRHLFKVFPTSTFIPQAFCQWKCPYVVPNPR